MKLIDLVNLIVALVIGIFIVIFWRIVGLDIDYNPTHNLIIAFSYTILCAIARMEKNN